MKAITRIASAAALCLSALLGASCVQEKENQQKPEFITGVTVTSDDIDFSEFETPDTKVSYSSSLKFSFTIGDRLAIFPVGGEQTAFPLSQLEADGSAKFDGGAWALRSSYTYAAYYPENTDKYAITDMTLPVSFETQYQTGNNSTDGLGPDAYLFSKASTPDVNGNVNIAMKQCAGVVRLMATMPKGIDVDKVVLRDMTRTLKIGGVVNLKTYSSNADQFPTITNGISGTVTVDVTGLTTASGENNLIVYLWLPAQTLNGHKMEMDVIAADGKIYTFSATCAKDLATMGTVGLNFGSYAGEFAVDGYSFRELVDGIYEPVGDELEVSLGHAMRFYAVAENNPGIFTPVTYDAVDYEILKAPDENVAKIGKLRTGVTAWLGISAVAPGHTDFTVAVTSKTTGDVLIRKSFTILVPDPAITGLRLDPDTMALKVGESNSVKAIITPAGTQASVSFAISDPSILEYDWEENGEYYFSAIRVGKSKIIATCGEFTAECEVNVVGSLIPLTGVSLTQSLYTAPAGERFNITPVFTPSNASNKAMTWILGDESIAEFEGTVDGSAEFIAKKEGTTTLKGISVDGGLIVNATIKVAPPTPPEGGVDLGYRYGDKPVFFHKYNLGSSSSYSFGDYFAWGDSSKYFEIEGPNTQRWLEGKTSGYTKESYKWYDSSTGSYTKYMNEPGKVSLQLEDDPAHQILGGCWRMPNVADLNWLIKNCTWIVDYTNLAYIVRSNVPGFEEQSIIIPMTGYFMDTTYHGYGQISKGGVEPFSTILAASGLYYNGDSTYSDEDINVLFCHMLDFNGTLYNDMRLLKEKRYYGFTIRPVWQTGLSK